MGLYFLLLLVLVYCFCNIAVWGRQRYLYFVFWSTCFLYLFTMILNNCFNLEDLQIKFSFLLKEIPILISSLTLVIHIFTRKKPNLFDIPLGVILYLIGCLLYFIFPNGISLGFKFSAFRDLTTVFFAIMVGYFIPLEFFNKKFIYSSVLSFTLFGLIELFLGPEIFWGFFNYLDLKEKLESANSIYNLAVGGFGANYTMFYNFDFLLLGMQPMQRLGLFYANAIESGHIFSIFSVATFGYFIDYPTVITTLLFFLACLSQILISGKGGIIIMFIGVMVILKQRMKKIFWFSFGVGAILIFISLSFLLRMEGISFLGHIGGLGNGIEAVISQPIGSGLGTAGALLNLNLDLDTASDVGDSMVGVIMVQGGLPLLLLFIYMHIELFIKLNRAYNKEQKIEILTCLSILVGTFICSFLTEGVYHYTSAYLLFIFCGSVLKYSYRQKEH